MDTSETNTSCTSLNLSDSEDNSLRFEPSETPEADIINIEVENGTDHDYLSQQQELSFVDIHNQVRR